MKKYSSISPSYPDTRLRRTRSSMFSKIITAEHSLSINDLIMPLFIIEGKGLLQPIESMPNIFRYSPDKILGIVEQIVSLGIPAIALFPNIENSIKDETGSLALNSKNLICETVRLIKSEFPDLGIICDVALDPYTDHGHDGLLINGEIDNDKTIDVLVKQSLVQAEAGCDAVAPSDMMDGRVSAIRHALDDNGYKDTQIISYAAKYASSFYGPFRDAIGSNNLKRSIDKTSYQMNPANSDEAMREISLDINEGADMIIIKPGMPYLDIIYRAKEEFSFPILAYQVSGEYSMIYHSSKKGYMDYKKTVLESLVCFKRAGACGILSYFSLDVAKLLKGM